MFIIYNTVHIELVYPVFPPSSSSLVFSEFITLFSFFHFILRFWNQIFICRSVRHRACEISILRLLVRYLLKWNSFSSSRVWNRVYVWRPLRPVVPGMPVKKDEKTKNWLTQSQKLKLYYYYYFYYYYYYCYYYHYYCCCYYYDYYYYCCCYCDYYWYLILIFIKI